MSTQLIVDPQATANAPDGDNAEQSLPDKYRGKSLEEIVTMHQNAETALGRANNEVGTLRRLSDEFLGIRSAELAREKADNQPKRVPITADALLEKPEEVILATIESEIERRSADRDARTNRLEAELAESKFARRFPDAESTLQDPEFQTWVRSGKHRQNLAMQASQGNFDAAEDLFGLYKDAVGGKPDTRQSPDGTAAARKAALAKSGGSAVTGVIPSADGKKVYKREELITMRIKDPEGFARLYETEDLATAYREKRVR